MLLINIVAFLIVLGVLIFVHELGHFIAAKACGIYIDRFSLGMPPRIAGIRLGETDYCIGALPIGGYVKMAGQEDAPRTEEEQQQDYGHVPPERWYNHKPVWQRAIVLGAGPFMNMVLGVLLYAAVVAHGAQVPETKVDARIGLIDDHAPAASAPLYRIADGQTQPPASPGSPDETGWQTGDRILYVDGERVHNIADVATEAILGAGKAMDVILERTTPSGSVTRYYSPVTPTVMDDTGHPRFGIQPFQTAYIQSAFPGRPAEAAGLKSGDTVTRADGRVVDAVTLKQLIESHPAGQPISLDVLRGDAHLNLSVTPGPTRRFQGIRFIYDLWASAPAAKQEEWTRAWAGLPVPVLEVTAEAAKATGLRPGDGVYLVDGTPADISRLADLQNSAPGATHTVTAARIKRVLFWRSIDTVQATLTVEETPAIGVEFGPRTVYERAAWNQVAPRAWEQSMRALTMTVRTLAGLVMGAVSARDLGGPIMIYQATTSAVQTGNLSWVLEITAFISINLCVFNLVPLPVLDGGQLVFLVLEAIRRKPLSTRTQEWVQQAGLLAIIALMLFVTYNDIMRVRAQ